MQNVICGNYSALLIRFGTGIIKRPNMRRVSVQIRAIREMHSVCIQHTTVIYTGNMLELSIRTIDHIFHSQVPKTFQAVFCRDNHIYRITTTATPSTEEGFNTFMLPYWLIYLSQTNITRFCRLFHISHLSVSGLRYSVSDFYCCVFRSVYQYAQSLLVSY